MFTWSSVGQQSAQGQAGSALEAWQQSVAHAMTLLGDGTEPVLLTVESSATAPASALLYPALDEHGQLDEPATRAVAERLLEELRRELRPQTRQAKYT